MNYEFTHTFSVFYLSNALSKLPFRHLNYEYTHFSKWISVTWTIARPFNQFWIYGSLLMLCFFLLPSRWFDRLRLCPKYLNNIEMHGSRGIFCDKILNFIFCLFPPCSLFLSYLSEIMWMAQIMNYFPNYMLKIA